MQRLLHLGMWMMIACTASSCAPGSELPPTTSGGTTSPSGGAAGTGGLLGGAGAGGTNGECAGASDADKDSIADMLEGKPDLDTDADGTPNVKDTDSDGDGWPDEVEATNPFLDPGQPGQSRSTPC